MIRIGYSYCLACLTLIRTLPTRAKIKWQNLSIHLRSYTPFADVQQHVFSHFQSYGLENKSIGVVFRVEFDGDVRFFVAPPKSMFLSMLIDFFDVFYNFFVFQVFVKILIFFSVPSPSQNLCRRGRGSRRRCGRRRSSRRVTLFLHINVAELADWRGDDWSAGV